MQLTNEQLTQLNEIFSSPSKVSERIEEVIKDFNNSIERNEFTISEFFEDDSLPLKFDSHPDRQTLFEEAVNSHYKDVITFFEAEELIEAINDYMREYKKTRRLVKELEKVI